MRSLLLDVNDKKRTLGTYKVAKLIRIIDIVHCDRRVIQLLANDGEIMQNPADIIVIMPCPI